MAAFQLQGSSASIREAGCSGNRASTSASQARGSTLLSLQVSISVYIAAARRPPASDPAKVQLRRPTANGRIARSAALFVAHARPSARKRVNEAQPQCDIDADTGCSNWERETFILPHSGAVARSP